MASSVGIDVGKRKLAVVVIRVDGKRRRKSAANTAAGHRELMEWLARHAPEPHVGLEATGGYQDALALALHAAGYRVSILPPQVIAAYAASQLRRAKTDPVDAEVIAGYVQTQQPPAWVPAPPEVRELQALVRRLDALLEMQTQEKNRLAGAAAVVAPSIQASLAHLATQIATVKQQIARHIDQHPMLRQQQNWLESIPGIGATTAARLLGELGDLARFTSARQVAAFAGLVPQIRQSGTSVRGRGRLSRLGSRRLRRSLYFPALTAMRCNPPLRRFAARLRQAGKPPMVIVAAVMRKLLHQAYAVLRTRHPFDPSAA